MELKIYYASNGETVGPFNLIEFHNLNLFDDTYVWFQGMPQWEMLKNVPDLAVSNISNVANPLNKKLLTELQRRPYPKNRGINLTCIDFLILIKICQINLFNLYSRNYL